MDGMSALISGLSTLVDGFIGSLPATCNILRIQETPNPVTGKQVTTWNSITPTPIPCGYYGYIRETDVLAAGRIEPLGTHVFILQGSARARETDRIQLVSSAIQASSILVGATFAIQKIQHEMETAQLLLVSLID